MVIYFDIRIGIEFAVFTRCNGRLWILIFLLKSPGLLGVRHLVFASEPM